MTISHNKPSIDENEEKAVAEVLKSKWIATGEKVKEFEKLISNYIGNHDSNAVAVSNGTTAIYLSLVALGVKPSDEVIMPTYVCSALLNAVNMLGAKPVITDVDYEDFNVSYNSLIEKINENTKAIIVPHLFGVPAEIHNLKELGIPIIEDCAQAIGSKIDSKSVGVFGKIAVFSFYATKMITTGQGGMVYSNDRSIIDNIRDYINFDCRTDYYPRFNFQMTDIQGALGIAQFGKLKDFLDKRKKIAETYQKICFQKGWDYQKPKSDIYLQNWYRFIIKGDTIFIQKLKTFLNDNEIKSIVPIERYELLHNYLKQSADDFENAELISQSTLSLPIYPDLVVDNLFEGILETLRRF
ncbi:MAG: DegT/DnrJ/EryC1/StrS aminotransferase family protein [Bacillota bacterium]|nr:DegT/DnrJ/EryC1/StrS aminotransferase family protein [Bacillota bacterium]